MALPTFSVEQRRKNLERSAKVRQKRAKVREDLKQGKISVSEVLRRDSDPAVARMKASALIESVPGYGKARALKLMDEIGISPSRRVQGLGTRQRTALVKALKK